MDAINLSRLPWYGQIAIFASLSAAATGAFWHFHAAPAQMVIDDQRARLATMQKEISRAQRTAKNLPEFRQEVSELEIQLERLRAVLPEEQDVADLLRRVQGMATRSRLAIRGFTPQVVTRQQLHAEWPIELELEGSYHDLGAFLDQVSKFPRIINVGNIRIKARDDQVAGTTITAACTATTFVAQEPAPDTATGPEPQGFTYSADGRRDPFVSLMRRGAEPAPDAAVRSPGLTGLAADDISLRGVMLSRGQYVGIVQGSDNKTYIVRAGQRLFDGTIRAIDKDSLVIVQRVNDRLALEKQRELRKAIRQDEAK